MGEEYEIYLNKPNLFELLGYMQDFKEGEGRYAPVWNAEEYKKKVKDKRFLEKTKDVGFIAEMMTEENRVKNHKRKCFKCGDIFIYNIPSRSGEKYLVYNRMAGKGEPGYSNKSHSAPHKEPSAPKEMEEWVNHYQFNKFDDGTYEAELDEAWYWGGSHTDGGTMYREIPEDWEKLPYDEFLEKVVQLAGAAHYNFTVDDLLACQGLKEFFGYKD